MRRDGILALPDKPEKKSGGGRLRDALKRRAFGKTLGEPRRDTSPFSQSPEHQQDVGLLFASMADEYEKVARREERHQMALDSIISAIGDESVHNLFQIIQHVEEQADYLSPQARKMAVEDLLKRIFKRIEAEEDPVRVITNLFETWAPTYDQHMADTGHDAAVNALMKQAIELRRMGLGNASNPIIGKNILEMSGGTGTVIKLLCDNLTLLDEPLIRVTLNDLSPAMADIAKRKLACFSHRCKLGGEQQDLRKARFGLGAYDTAILSQTLHLITDPELLHAEGDPDAVAESPDHRHIKRKVIEKAFEALTLDGHFIMIDEWPAKLSDQPDRPMERIIHRMFHETFRPIVDRSIFRDNVMQNVKGARFVAELKARIDGKHSMYMIIYRKDRDKLYNTERPLPYDSKEARERGIGWGKVEKARKDAMDTIVKCCTGIDRHFIQTYRPVNGERAKWTDFIPFSLPWESPLSVNNPSNLQMSREKSQFDTIVISERLHQMAERPRRDMIGKVLKSLKIGGAILIVDEWPPPAGSLGPIRKRDIRNVLMEQFQKRVIFEGSMRQTIMHGYSSGYYGYLFRKIKCV
ncbi:methyltransferase domain-containing protein [Candidatus Micrarchaeota archaeon]|nr:methyltransferase domain-containing protein [Candidatus Micrarchaeota archaeon]